MSLATMIGCIAILGWGLSALLVLQLKHIPPFEIMAISYGISSLILIGNLSIHHRWDQLKQPPSIWCLGILGIYITTVFYIFALQFAQAPIVVLISYTWPVMGLLLLLLSPAEKLQWPILLAAAIAYLGIYLIVYERPETLSGPQLLGYGLALMSAFSWAIYSSIASKLKQYSIQAIGIYCLIGFFASILLHGLFETTVIPSLKQSIIMICMGMTVSGPVFMLWEYGIKYGEHRFLFIASYFTPVISNGLLVMFGEAHSTLRLWIATLLVIISSIIALNAKSRA